MHAANDFHFYMEAMVDAIKTLPVTVKDRMTGAYTCVERQCMRLEEGNE
jgi:hypothetical protein